MIKQTTWHIWLSYLMQILFAVTGMQVIYLLIALYFKNAAANGLEYGHFAWQLSTAWSILLFSIPALGCALLGFPTLAITLALAALGITVGRTGRGMLALARYQVPAQEK